MSTLNAFSLFIQRRSIGQTSAGRYTVNNGSPTNNGLAAMTLRFGAS